MKRLFIFLLILFNANLAFGYYTENVVDGCDNQILDFDNDNLSVMYASFTPFSYTCDTGYFLPADTLGCVVCPTGYDCGGGTFNFNELIASGINTKSTITQNVNNICSQNLVESDNNDVSYIYADFTINTYTCNPGYYLPAGQDWLTDNDGCTICPADSYCVGGTYTFNENIAQGAVSCATGLFAPAGMWESAQCGRILHVGDGFVYLRATKKTSPALHLDLDHDGVADYFGNMTTLDVPMSRDTQRKLKVRYNNITYSIYDDSVELPTE